MFLILCVKNREKLVESEKIVCYYYLINRKRKEEIQMKERRTESLGAVHTHTHTQ